MSEMIERVARIIDPESFEKWEKGGHPEKINSVAPLAKAREKARAAIEAMREPPSELYEALYEAMFIEKYDGTQAPMIGAGVDAFIDAALKEPTP